MSQYWNDQVTHWYEQALQWSNYPEDLLGDIFSQEINENDTVLDAGCGIGAISLFVASFCRRVVAVDVHPEALHVLQKKAQTAHVNNLETYLGEWPDVDIDMVDVSICTYAPPISHSAKSLKKLLDVTRKTGIILTPFRSIKDNSAIDILANTLGLPNKQRSCSNGCWEKGFIEGNGLHIECRPLVHDFSQPVDDYEEAWEFLRHQLQAPEQLKHQALKEIPQHMERRHGQLLVPIIRENCLLIFKKQ